MKRLKILGLATIATGALMAFMGASTASATTITCTAGTHCPIGTKVHLQSEGHFVIDSTAGKIECNHTIEGKTITTGGGGPPTQSVLISVETTSFTGCTTATFHVLKAGTLQITSSGSGKGTVVSTGAEWTTVTFGIHCLFATNNTTIGTVTGGTPAKLAISATIPRTGGSSGAFCGSSAPLTGSAKVTSPSTLFVD